MKGAMTRPGVYQMATMATMATIHAMRESVIDLRAFSRPSLTESVDLFASRSFFDVARVVREHDEADADDGGCRPDEHHGFEAKRENLKARERNEAAHDDAADRFSDGEV